MEMLTKNGGPSRARTYDASVMEVNTRFELIYFINERITYANSPQPIALPTEL